MIVVLLVNTVGSNTIKGTIVSYMWAGKLDLLDILGDQFVIEYKEMHPNIKASEVFEDISWVEKHGISVTLRKAAV